MSGATTISAGLDGTFNGTCVICLTPTDTVLGFQGEAEWCISGLYTLGIPMDEAVIMAEHCWGADPGLVPQGTQYVGVQVCNECVAKVEPPFPKPQLAALGRFPVLGVRG